MINVDTRRLHLISIILCYAAYAMQRSLTFLYLAISQAGANGNHFKKITSKKPRRNEGSLVLNRKPRFNRPQITCHGAKGTDSSLVDFCHALRHEVKECKLARRAPNLVDKAACKMASKDGAEIIIGNLHRHQ